MTQIEHANTWRGKSFSTTGVDTEFTWGDYTECPWVGSDNLIVGRNRDREGKPET